MRHATDRPTPPVISFLSPAVAVGQTGTLANLALLLAGNGGRVLVVDWAMERPHVGDYLHPFLIDQLNVDDVLGPNLTTAFGTAGGWLGVAPPPAVERFGIAGITGRVDLLISTKSGFSTFDGDTDALAGLRPQLLDSAYDYVLIDFPPAVENSGPVVAANVSDVVVVCFAARPRVINEAAELAGRLRQIAPVSVGIVPVVSSYGPNPKNAASAVTSAFAEVLEMRESPGAPRDVISIPYQPTDAFDPVLVLLANDSPARENLENAYQGLAGAVTSGRVAHVPRLPESELLRYRRVSGVAPSNAPVAVVLVNEPREQPWADWVGSHLRSAGVIALGRNDDLTGVGDFGPAYVAVIGPGDAPEADASDDRILASLGVAERRKVDVVHLVTGGDRRSTGRPGAIVLAGAEPRQVLTRLLNYFGLTPPEKARTTQPRFPNAIPQFERLPGPHGTFVGREEQLNQIHTRLARQSGGGHVPTVWLTGPPGVGKTTLALEYARRFRFDYDIVCWLPAFSRQSVLDGVGALQDWLNPADDADAFDALSRSDHRWLLVYDNADDIDVLSGLVPVAGDGHLIITGDVERVDGIAVELAELEPEEAVELLSESALPLDPVQARRIARTAGYLPLTLNLAVAWLNHSAENAKHGNEQVPADFVRQVERIQAEQNGTPVECVVQVVLNAMGRTWHGRSAELLAQLCSFLSPQGVSITMLRSKAMWNQLVAMTRHDRDTSELAFDTSLLDHLLWMGMSFGLYRVDWGTKPMLRMHRVVQSAVRRSMGEVLADTRRKQVLAGLSAYAPSDVDNDYLSGLHRYDELRKHVLRSGAIDSGDDQVRLWLVNQVRYAYLAGGEATLTVTLDAVDTVIREWTRRYRGVDPLLLRIMAQAGNIYRKMGKLSDALQIDSATVDLQRSQLGSDHPQTLITMKGVGADLRGMGQFEQARTADQSTWRGLRRVLGDDHPHTREAANNLAVSHFLSGDAAEALKDERANLERLGRLFGADHPKVWWSQCSVGVYLRELGRYVEASEILRRARDNSAAQAGGVDELELRIQWNVAITERITGRPEVARDRNQRTLRESQNLLGRDHPWTIGCLVSLANDQGALGEPRLAAQRMDQCARKYQEIGLSSDHPFVALCQTSLAQHRLAADDRPAAQAASTIAIDALRERLTRTHPWLLAATVNHAGVLIAGGDTAQGRALLREAWEQLRTVVGESHPYTRTAAENLRSSSSTWRGIHVDIPQT